MKDNKISIESNYHKLIQIESIFKKDMEIDISNDNYRVLIYDFMKSLLTILGMNLTAPNDRKRKNETYKIKPDKKLVQLRKQKEDNNILILKKIDNIEYLNYYDNDKVLKILEMKTKKSGESNIYNINKNTGKIKIKPSILKKIGYDDKITINLFESGNVLKSYSQEHRQFKIKSLDKDIYTKELKEDEVSYGLNRDTEKTDIINDSYMKDNKIKRNIIIKKNKLNEKVLKNYHEFFKRFKMIDFNDDTTLKNIYEENRDIQEEIKYKPKCLIEDEEDIEIKEMSKEESLALDKGIEDY